MSDIKDGGPAFPVADPFALNPHDKVEMERLASGMTLRDYFAAKAINGTLPGRLVADAEVDVCAKLAYRMADAMLRAREAP